MFNISMVEKEKQKKRKKMEGRKEYVEAALKHNCRWYIPL